MNGLIWVVQLSINSRIRNVKVNILVIGWQRLSGLLEGVLLWLGRYIDLGNRMSSRNMCVSSKFLGY